MLTPKVMKGFGTAFEALGHEVILAKRDEIIPPIFSTKDVKTICNGIIKLAPSFILAYSTNGLFVVKGDGKYTNITEKLKIPFVSYFGDDLDFYINAKIEDIRRMTQEIFRMENCVVFVHTNLSIERYGNLARRMYLLPLGCDTLRYNPFMQIDETVVKRFACDISFAGNHSAYREEALACLEDLSMYIYGKGWEGSKLRNYHKGWLDNEIDLPILYKNSKINVNVKAGERYNFVGMKPFEVLGSGGFLLTYTCKEMEEMFEPEKEIAIYKDPEELREKILYYLRNENERERIASAGYNRVKSSHTYVHRAVRLLEIPKEEGMI
jgi:spore maturation protein CgeB